METTIINEKIKGTDRHWKNFLDRNYLGSHNLESKEEMLLTIVKFEGEEMVQSADGEKRPMVVIYFQETVPKMILNITNANTISSLYGSQPDKWLEKQIQIYATPVKAFGKTQDALRIRDFVPKHEVDVTAYKSKLELATTLDELKNIWIKLPASVRNDKELIAEKDIIKEELKGGDPDGEPQK